MAWYQAWAKKRPFFFYGFTSVFSLFPSLDFPWGTPSKDNPSGLPSNEEALEEDFRVVGDDMKAALREFSRSL